MINKGLVCRVMSKYHQLWTYSPSLTNLEIVYQVWLYMALSAIILRPLTFVSTYVSSISAKRSSIFEFAAISLENLTVSCVTPTSKSNA